MVYIPHLNSNQTCRQCGQCCRKGGPALHKEDLDLVLNGSIPLKNLFTIREGELVFNQIKNINEPATKDIIKIKGCDAKTWCCYYYDSTRKTCKIYIHRPLECRVLMCWDTQPIESVYQRDRLNRKDIFERISGLMELIDFHQNYCDHNKIRNWLADLSRQNPATEKFIIESIHWDQRIRLLAHEKANVTFDQLDLIFGRPLHQILKILGWKIHKEDNGHIHLSSFTPTL